jgi:hypothetical protein
LRVRYGELVLENGVEGKRIWGVRDGGGDGVVEEKEEVMNKPYISQILKSVALR